MIGQHGEVRTGSQTNHRLYRLPGGLEQRQDQTDPRALADLTIKNKKTALHTHLPSPAADVPDRAIDTPRETSPLRLTP